MAKEPKIPNVSPEVDPADAFARVNPDDIGQDDPDIASDDAPSKPRGSKKKARREPKIETATGTIRPIAAEDGMDPLDAAKAISKMADQIFGLVAHLRGYAAMTLPDGTKLLDLAAPSAEDKEGFEKALARLMKSTGASMSPGAACAFMAFTCYGAPIMALEAARWQTAKAAKPGV